VLSAKPSTLLLVLNFIACSCKRAYYDSVQDCMTLGVAASEEQLITEPELGFVSLA
jgi:hypothetical protein